MADPLGLITSASSPALPIRPKPPVNAGGVEAGGFKAMLRQQIDEVNQLQKDAKEAIEDLATGKRDDLESVMIATQKADTAFRMLLQIRNKVMDAYEEVKQMRV